MRCPGCHYELWNLTTPVCPECGRGFVLSEWDWEKGEARFACVSCGEVLPGLVPSALPERCGVCGEAVDASRVRVLPGTSDSDVPRLDDPDRLTLIGGMICTGIMVLSVICGGLTLLAAARNGGGDARLLLFFAIIGIMAGFAGFWPKGHRRRAVVVFSLLVLMCVAGIVAVEVGNIRRQRMHLPLQHARYVRGVVQSVEMYRQTYGSFPSDPNALVANGFVPIELFYERRSAIPSQLTWTRLPDGWIEVGMFRIDWDEASWVSYSHPASGQIALVIAVPTQRLPATSVGFADMHVDLYYWQRFWREQPQWDADRKAAGLKPIPNAALPTRP